MMEFSAPLSINSGLPPYLAAASGSWSSWNGAILLTALIVFLIVTVLYMISIAFNLPSLKQWCKGEYLEVLVTLLIAGSVIAMTDVMWPFLANAMVNIYNLAYPGNTVFSASDLLQPGGTYVDPFEFVQAYIDQVLLQCEKFVYRLLYILNALFEPVQNLSTEVLGAESLGGWYASLYTGFFKWGAGSLAQLMIVNYVQVRLLTLIKYAMPLVMIMGLVLRAFPFTRGTGGLLLAIGFGFFFVYPISLAVLMLFQPVPQDAACTQFVPPSSIDPTKNTMTMSTKAEVLRYSMRLKQEQNWISTLFDKVRNFMPLFYLQSVFFPIVALIITFTFIRQAGALFGADLAEIGRGLIKFI